jgi:hypothetical protein
MLVSANWNLFVGNCCSSSEVMLARYSPSLSQCFFAWYQALPVGLLEQHIAVLVAISALSAGVLVSNTAKLPRFAANLQITIDHEVWGLQTALLAQKELVLVHLRRANGQKEGKQYSVLMLRVMPTVQFATCIASCI